MNQSLAARAVETCHHFVEEIPVRWHLNYGRHYDDCLSVVASHGNEEQEHRARADALNECIND